jgi:hypothetical protein
VNSFFRLTKDEAVGKREPFIEKMRLMIDAEYADGRNTCMGDGELETMLQQADYNEYERLNHIHLGKKLSESKD